MIIHFLKRIFTWFLILQYTFLSIAQATGDQFLFELRDISTKQKTIYSLDIKKQDATGHQFDLFDLKIEKKDTFLQLFSIPQDQPSFSVTQTSLRKTIHVQYISPETRDQLGFYIHSDGSFLLDYMKGRGDFSLSTFASMTLRSKSLAAESLSLVGTQVSNESHLKVDNLSIKTTDSTKKPTILNTAHGIITAQKKIDILNGNFNNQGGIRSQGDLVIDLHGKSLINTDCQALHKGIASTAGLSFQNVQTLSNFTTINAVNLSFQGKTFINDVEGTIGVTRSGILKTSESLHNTGIIDGQGSDNILLIESDKNLKNDGTLTAAWLTLKANHLDNQKMINGRSFLTLTGDFLKNDGHMTGQEEIRLSEFSKVYNNGTIQTSGIANLLALGDVINHEKIECGHGLLTFEGQRLTNEGLIYAKTIKMKFKEEILANNIIKADDLLSIKTGKLVNRTKLIGNVINLTTKNTFENYQDIISKEDLSLNTSGTSFNNGLLQVETDVSLTNQGVFTNNRDIILNPARQFMINGTGEFINTTGISADHFSIISMGKMRNTGTIQAQTGTWTVGDFTNTKDITFADNLDLTLATGTNYGTLTANSLAILIHQLLTNTGTLEAAALTIDGNNVGVLTNEGILKSTGQLDLTALKKLKNSGSIEGQNGTWTVAHLKNSDNIVIQDLFVLALTTGRNSGQLKAKNLKLTAQQRFVNDRLVETTDQLTILNSEELTNRGTLRSHNTLNLEKLRTLNNHADIHSKTGTWTVGDLTNSTDITFTNKFALTLATGTNNGTLIVPDLTLRVKEKFINYNKVDAAIKMHLMGGGSIDNQGILMSDDMTIDTLSILQNNGTIKGQTGTWTVGNLTNNTDITFTDKLALTLTTGTNSGTLTVNHLSFLVHQLLTNTGTVQTTADFIMHGNGAFQNSKTLSSVAHLTFDGLSKLTNTGTLSSKNIHLKNIAKVNNTITGAINSQGTFTLELIKQVINKGKLDSHDLLTLLSSHVMNHQQSSLIARNGLTLDLHSSLINHGLGSSKGLLQGNLSALFSQNQGTWAHIGLIDPLDNELILKGTTDWQAGTSIKSSSQKSLKIVSNGTATFRNGGLQANGFLNIVNNGSLTFYDKKSQSFQSMVNKKDLYLTFDEDAKSSTAWTISPHATGGVTFTPDAVKPVASGNNTAFTNSGVIHTSKDLYFQLASSLGKANVAGNLQYQNQPIVIKDLRFITCGGIVNGTIAGDLSFENLDLSTINHLNLTSTQPLTLSGHLSVPMLTLYSTALITLGKNEKHFAHLQTTTGDLLLKAPTIDARFAKLSAAGDLNIQTPTQLKVGGFITKSTDVAKKLGPWKGENTINDLFQTTRDNTYRASNGSLLNAGKSIILSGKNLDLSYCTLLSQLETKITSSTPLDLLSVALQGHGDLYIDAPTIQFSFAGIRQAQATKKYQIQRKMWFTNSTYLINLQQHVVYDYLASEPTSLLYQGNVTLKGSHIDFTGTSCTANNLYINGQSYSPKKSNSSVTLTPIPLGEKDLNHHYATLEHISSGHRTHHYMRKITFFTAARDLLGKSPYWGYDHSSGAEGEPTDCTSKHSVWKLKDFLGSGFYGEFKVPGATVAEIDALGRSRSSTAVANAILHAHQTGTPFKGWTGPAITPTFIIGGKTKIATSLLQGQMQFDGQVLEATTTTNDLYNNSVRDLDKVLKSMDIDLGDTPQALFLDFIQSSLGQDLMGHRLAISDLPVVASSSSAAPAKPDGIFLSSLNLHVPIDLVFHAAMAEHAKRLHHHKLSGKALLQQVLERSKRLQQLQQLTYKQLAQDGQLTLYAQTTASSSIGQVMLHMPASVQNPYPQSISQDVLSLQAANDNTIQDQRLVIGQAGEITGRNVTLASTAQTSSHNNITTQNPHAPMTVLGAEQAQLHLKADDTSTLIGADVTGFDQITHQAGAAVNTTALKMQDTTTVHEGSKRTTTTKDHHLVTTIASPGTYTETAPKHFHEGTAYQNTLTHLIGKKVKATSVMDYTSTTTEEHDSTSWGKKTKTKTYTQTPTDVSQSVYQGINILDVDTYEGEGSIFRGVTHDNTGMMRLKPAIATALSYFETNSRWIGITSGVKVDQGKEQLFQPQIEGELISKRKKDAENILHLTSTILDLNKSQIDKIIKKDTYQPKEWHHQKTTGNAQTVALTVSLIVSLATWSTCGQFATMMFEGAMAQTMAQASFSTLISTVASSFVVNQGDLGKVTKDVLSSNTLKSVAISAGTAGIMKGLSSKFPMLNVKGELHERFLYHVVHSSTSLHIDIALNNGSYAKLAKSAGLSAVAATMSGYLSHSIGNLLDDQKIDSLTHKLLHGAVGAVSTTLTGDGFVAGALGAVVAESVAEVAFEAKLPALEEKYTQRQDDWRKESADGRLTLDQRQTLEQQFNDDLGRLKENCADIARYASIASAVLAKQNPVAVFNAAENAVNENFLKHGMKALRVAGVALSGYEIVDAYMMNGPEAALMKAGEIGLITVAIGAGGRIVYEVGGVVSHNAVQAWKLTCEYYPTLSKISQSIYQGVGAVKNSGIYQQGASLLNTGVTAVTNSGIYQTTASSSVVQGVGKAIDAVDSVVEGTLALGGQVASKGIKALTGGGVKHVPSSVLIQDAPSPSASSSSSGATSSKYPINRELLQNQLTSHQQLDEVGTIIAGVGAKQEFRNASKMALRYGGVASDWVKKSSSQAFTKEGKGFEIHWIENLKTGERVEHKTVFSKKGR